MKKTPNKQNQITEQELLDTIENISKNLAYKFRFGYHEIEDMRQQISVFAIEGLEKYDYERPLENFLWTHVRNRLFNFKRDNYQRPDKPCKTCPLYNSLCADTEKDCLEHNNKLDCEMYRSWYARNNSKKNLMYLNTMEELKEYFPVTKYSGESIENQDFIMFIEERIFGFDREIYLKLKNGCKVNKKNIQTLTKHIKDILDE
jgi:hypothetical protein